MSTCIFGKSYTIIIFVILLELAKKFISIDEARISMKTVVCVVHPRGTDINIARLSAQVQALNMITLEHEKVLQFADVGDEINVGQCTTINSKGDQVGEKHEDAFDEFFWHTTTMHLDTQVTQFGTCRVRYIICTIKKNGCLEVSQIRVWEDSGER